MEWSAGAAFCARKDEEVAMAESPSTVSDVMTRTVAAVVGAATFREIVRTMKQWNVSALPVLTGDSRVIGVVSEADLLLKEEFRGMEPSRMEQARRLDDIAKLGGVTAGELMSSPAAVVHADATLPEAARLMARRKVKRLPVIDDEDRLEGVVSRGDLLKVFLRPDADIEREVQEEVATPLFAVSPPLGVHVSDGVVTLSGRITDSSLIPVAIRLARSVDGVVDIECELSGATYAMPGSRTSK